MRGDARTSAVRRLLAGLALAAAGAAGPASAPAAEASFSVDLGREEWKALRLRNLPEGASLRAEVRTDGAIGVVFLSEADYARYPEPLRPLFRSSTSTELSVAVAIPTSGHYYVVLHNRSPDEERAVSLEVHAAAAKAPKQQEPEALSLEPVQTAEPAPALSPEVQAAQREAMEAQLRAFQQQLAEVLIFEPFPIQVESCGKPRAYTDVKRVVLCREAILKLYTELDGKEKARDVLVFVLFHELSHVLLAQWEYPAYDNEDVADEFATVLMLVLGQGRRLRASVEYLVEQPTALELAAKTRRSDRHSLSIQRARNLVAWAREGEALLSRWQPLLLPHMHTSALQKLREAAPAWVDLPRLERELAGRGA